MGRITGRIEHLDRLIARGQVGVRLTTGWRVVIAGRPNVGKSRLLNALAGYQRAIVDPTPGTTRDLVTALTAFDGWPVELVDTAGVRETDDAIERSGIDRTLQQTETADLVLKVLDRSEPLQVDDRTLMSSPGPALLVANKADLPPAWELCEATATASILAVSAERGDGLDHLLATVVAALVPVTPEPGAGVPFRREYLDRLVLARAALAGGNHELAIQSIEPMLARNACRVETRVQESAGGGEGIRLRSGPRPAAGPFGSSCRSSLVSDEADRQSSSFLRNFTLSVTGDSSLGSKEVVHSDRL